jgi:hypothetical protein
MSEEEGNRIHGVPIAGVDDAGARGEQSVVIADQVIEVEDAAHRRDMERQRVQRELEKDKREEEEKFIDRKHQRWRDNCTYAVVVGLIISGLVGSFYVAVTSTDTTRQIWAQGLTTTIAGVVGGAFAGYVIGGRK